MKLPVPFVQLPLLYDADRLRTEIDMLGDDAWRPHPQGFHGNSMLPLIAVDGDPADESFSGAMLPTPELQRCPYLMQTLESLGATLGRTRLMRLAGRAEVARHVDQGYYWAERVRVHVPVLTQPSVRFECGDAAVNMAAGECWIFDTWREHRVMNDSDDTRIHLVADTVGGDQFWGYVARGRTGPADPRPWNPQRIECSTGRAAKLDCETVNLPRVMSPWEMNSHFGLLFNDAKPHPQLGAVVQMTRHFVRIWQGLWMRYGDSGKGLADYREELVRYTAAVRAPGDSIMLTNGLRWYNAMQSIIAQPALLLPPRMVGAVVPDEYGSVDRG